MKDEPIHVGTQKQLFIDDRFIADSAGVDLVMNPARVRDEPVLVADRPWEASIAAYNTVIEDGGRYRMWYDFIPPEDDPSGITRGVAYAESADGVHWEKPEIGLVEIGGSKANNVVIPRLPDAPRGETEGGTVLLDPNPDCRPGERYKFWTKIRGIPDEDVARGMVGQFWQMYSDDGIYWNVYPKDTEIVPCDTQNVPLWDDRIGRYVGYGRTRNQMNGFRVRGVGRTESADFRAWTDMVEVFRADDEDWRWAPRPEWRGRLGGYVDVYTNAAMKYPYAQDVYVMLPTFLYHWESVAVVEAEGDEAGDAHVNFPDTADVRLVTSRDGISWHAGARPSGLPAGRTRGRAELAAGLRGARRRTRRRHAPDLPLRHEREPLRAVRRRVGATRRRRAHRRVASGRLHVGRHALRRRMAGHAAHRLRGRPAGAQRRHRRRGLGARRDTGRGRRAHRWLHEGRLPDPERQLGADAGALRRRRRSEYARRQAGAAPDRDVRDEAVRLPVLVDADTIYSRQVGGLAAETGTARRSREDGNPSPRPLDSRRALPDVAGMTWCKASTRKRGGV